MIPKCRGCGSEWDMMCEYVRDGYHYATTWDRCIGLKGHLDIIIVDDVGNKVVW